MSSEVPGCNRVRGTAPASCRPGPLVACGPVASAAGRKFLIRGAFGARVQIPDSGTKAVVGLAARSTLGSPRAGQLAVR